MESIKALLPDGETTLVLHCCCAPCSSSIIERLLQCGITPQLFFYNPNIFPYSEYERRKSELVRFAQRRNVSVVDVDYDHQKWCDAINGYEQEPERGKRCCLCFAMRLRATAAYAFQQGFRVISSTLGMSRWKNFAAVTQAGIEAASAFPPVVYWDYHWRKMGGVPLMDSLVKKEGLYQQRYCGCIYSQKIALSKAKIRTTFPLQ